MNFAMTAARATLERLLEGNPATKGMYVRVHGKNLIVGREESFAGEVERVDRVRLTRVNQVHYELAVKLHAGRWERTPFAGPLEDVVGDVLQGLPHLVAALC
jgi:citrate lyase beta subunit